MVFKLKYDIVLITLLIAVHKSLLNDYDRTSNFCVYLTCDVWIPDLARLEEV